MFSVFKTLTEQVVTVELKNDLCVQGTLKSVDQCVQRAIASQACGEMGASRGVKWGKKGQGRLMVVADPRFLNIRLDDIAVSDPERFPHMVSRVEKRARRCSREDQKCCVARDISGSGEDGRACRREGGSRGSARDGRACDTSATGSSRAAREIQKAPYGKTPHGTDRGIV